MQKKIVKKNEYPVFIQNFIGIIISSSAGILITLIFTLLLSILLNKTPVLSDNMHFYLSGAVSLGVIANGFISTFKCNLKGIISGLVSAIPFALNITAVLLLFSSGQLGTKTGFLYLIILILSAIGGILGANTKRRR